MTKHLDEVGETYWMHLWFCVRASFFLLLAVFFLILHGLTGGLLNAPKGWRLEGVQKKLAALSEGRGGSSDDSM